MSRKIGQKFCLFEDLCGATPSVLKEKEMFNGLSLLSTEYITDVIIIKKIIVRTISQ